MLKRTLSVILAIAMLCTLVPAYVLAEEVEAVVVENEEVIVADEELEVAPMADPFDTSLLVADGVQQPAGIEIPETIKNYNISSINDKAKDIEALTAEDVPEGLTYVLVDSDDETKSNFTATHTGAWIAAEGNEHPWVDGVNTRRSSSTTNLSVHEAEIYVPAGEDRTLQIVTMVARKYTAEDAGRYAVDGLPTGQGALVWVDDEPVAVNAEAGHDVIGSIQSPSLWFEKGLVDWNVDTTYYAWEWGPTVTLEADAWHTIKFMPAGGADGARIPGIILTEAVGYDWSQIVPFPKKTYAYSSQYKKAITRMANTFGAAGYIDLEGPEFQNAVEADEELTTATTLVFNVPEAVDNSKYDFAPIEYKAFVNDVEADIVDGVVTVEDLAPAAEVLVEVVAIDMLGNETVEEATLKTAGADKLNYAFFAPDAEIKNITGLTNVKDSIEITWTAATAGTAEVAEPVVTYNVYVDGELDGTAADNEYTIEGLAENTEYDIKVVTCSDGVEATEDCINSSLELTVSTAKADEITVVAESTTATSAVLEVSKYVEESTLEIVEIIVNGVVVDDATVSGTKVTVKGLVSGASNVIKVTLKETAGEDSVEHKYDVITVKALANNDYTLSAEDCIAVESDYPMPMTYKTAAEWPLWDANTNSTKLFGPSEVFDGHDGRKAKMTMKVKTAGNYYAVSDLYTYSTSRYMTATIGGTALGHKFGAEDTSLHLEVAPTPVALEAGSYEVVLAATGGHVRVGFFALIPEELAYAEDGSLLDAAGVAESIKKFVDATFTSETALMNFFIKDSRILNESSLNEVRLMTEDSAIVSWKPTSFALGADIVYTVSLDGKKVGEVTSNQPHEFVLENVAAGTHTVSVKANVDNEAQTTTFSIGGVLPVVSIDKVDGKDGVTTINSVTVDLTNMTGTDRDIVVFVATFNKGVMEVKAFDDCDGLTYGKPQTLEITLAEPLTTTLAGVADKLDAEKSMTKIFIVDGDTFVPFAY